MFLGPEKRIIVACDVSTEPELIEILEELGPFGVLFKIGKQLFHSIGTPRAIELVTKYGGQIFLDAKLKDIEKTVVQAATAICAQGVQMLNVHATMPPSTLGAFAQVCDHYDTRSLGVSVLTDHDEEECDHIYGTDVRSKVTACALDAYRAGMSGLICSPNELKWLNEKVNGDYAWLESDDLVDLADVQPPFMFVTPGIRPTWAAPDGQTRFTTPGQAIRDGADCLVIGSPIVKAASYKMTRAEALEKIIEEVGDALVGRLLVERGAILEGRFVYTSGKHGSHYINKDVLYQLPEDLDWLSSWMAKKAAQSHVQVVLGAAVAGVPLSQNTARHLGPGVFSAYAEKDGDELILKRGYDKLVRGKRVLIVEDILTTGSTVRKLIKLAQSHGAHVVGVVAICNRGGVIHADLGLEEKLFKSLHHVSFAAFDVEEMPDWLAERPINIDVGHGAAYLAAQEA